MIKQFTHDGHYMVFRLAPKQGRQIQERLMPDHVPTRAHKSRAIAEKMADRLAKRNPGVSFAVLQIVSNAKE